MINDRHNPDEVKKMLSSSQRAAWMKADELIAEKAVVQPGMTCVDLGCGAGIVSIPVSMMVGSEGKVYAVDMKKELLDHIKEQNPPASLATVNRDVTDTGLESDIADVCFMVLILHEVPTDKALKEAYRLLKKGGKAVILEWIGTRTPNGPSEAERVGSDRMKALCEEAGFTGIEITTPWTENHYVLTAVK